MNEEPVTPENTKKEVPIQQPMVVHVERPLEPEQMAISPKQQARHEESVRRYPDLNLSNGEYVILAVSRHPIGLFMPLFAGTLLIAAALSILVNFDVISENIPLLVSTGGVESIATPVIAFIVAVALGMFVSYYVYVSNKFFMTNESVVQEIRHSIFSQREQTVSLANIEDASYTKRGILQQLFDYGDIRLSTEGDETTYRFSYVAHPKEHIARLNNAVEAFKNGRAVAED